MRILSERMHAGIDGLRGFAAAPRRIVAGLALTLAVGAGGHTAAAQAFSVTNLLSDGSVPATTTDANFINPWGLSASPNWWISTAGTGYNYVVPAAGTIAFKVIVPLGAKPTVNGLPSGSVTAAGSTGFLLPNGAVPSFFFSTLDGTISGWNGRLGTANALSQIVVNHSATGASYTGLALLNTASGSFLLAPNFATAAVEVYDSTYKAAKLAGTFTDPNLPANYAPFSIHILGTQVFIAYAQRTAAAPYRSQDAPGAGVLDVYDTGGNFVARAITGGNLNSPWGVAIAPSSFGMFSNDLLVGDFGDGKINAYDPKTFAYVGQLMDSTGNSLVYASLWDLVTGGTRVAGTTAVSAGDTGSVYFTAGLDKEAHGLLGSIASRTIAGAAPAFGLSTADSALTVKAGNTATTSVHVVSANGFAGTVTLACSGLPAGATCTFTPAQLAVSATVPTSGSVTINTTAATAELHLLRRGHTASGIVAALLLPFALMLGWRRRRMMHAVLMLTAIAILGGVTLLTGCADSAPAATPTPAGLANVTITATLGAAAQQTTVAVTVQ